MHLHLYQASTQLEPRQSSLEKLIQSLPADLQPRANRYKSERAAINFAYGRRLLSLGLKSLTGSPSLKDITIDTNDKPQHPSVYFNISHSAFRAVCALSLEGEVGIDIERDNPIDYLVFDDFFTTREWEYINDMEKENGFYKLWTRKESLIKAAGLGLRYLNQVELDPESDSIVFDGKEWHFTKLDFGDYYIATLCTEYAVTKLDIVQC